MSVLMRGAGRTAFMAIQPLNVCHVFVVPDDQAAYLTDLPEDAGARVFRTAQKVAALHDSGLGWEGVNLFLADGEAAGTAPTPARHTPFRGRRLRSDVRPGLHGRV